MDYEKFEKWSSVLLEAYSKQPADGYRKVSIEQIQDADMEMFKILVKDTRGGIRPLGGVAPIEQSLDRAITSAEVRLHLQPLPAGSGVKRKSDAEDEDRGADDVKVCQRKRKVETHC